MFQEASAPEQHYQGRSRRRRKESRRRTTTRSRSMTKRRIRTTGPDASVVNTGSQHVCEAGAGC